VPEEIWGPLGGWRERPGFCSPENPSAPQFPRSALAWEPEQGKARAGWRGRDAGQDGANELRGAGLGAVPKSPKYPGSPDSPPPTELGRAPTPLPHHWDWEQREGPQDPPPVPRAGSKPTALRVGGQGGCWGGGMLGLGVLCMCTRVDACPCRLSLRVHACGCVCVCMPVPS